MQWSIEMLDVVGTAKSMEDWIVDLVLHFMWQRRRSW